MGACVLAFAAGALTVLSPCVLPLLPFAVASALEQHRLGPAALTGGLVVSATVLGLFFAIVGFSVDRDLVRLLAGALLIVLGAILWSPLLQTRFARLATPLASRAAGLVGRVRRPGWQGQFLVGLLLGAIWSPCAGPTLAAAITLAARGQRLPSAFAVMAAFSLGAAVPLLAIAYGSRGVLGARAAALARAARPVTAAVLILVGALTVSGGDRVIETRLVDVMPGWMIDLGSLF